ncbi:MAG: tRNA uridine-5-carboxymethylaminomethyl(34) synthesis enzyme MnmG [Bacteriovoracaceae bacterium]|jgi:tRNA uridine 5-carboxymethylaminomethyl modification enzyme|nr:tRNA uridine-5-carboxymethylaminomethyl(34) synthesis enzyme MnmG [Bacteriovoracaceae bacterium]
MYDIAVIGGGHAGVEAAHIASQFKDLKIAIISMPGIGLASAPCNPSIGGVGKGQVVREIDAMGGICGRLADMAGIQFRILNESKGYAVQSTRIQIDKIKYSKYATQILSKIDNIDIIEEKVLDIKKLEDNFIVKTDCSTWNTKKVIVTVGTFLNGKMHTGSEVSFGGRIDCESSDSLASIFKEIKTLGLRFKTGTPARLHKDSIDYSKLEEQPSDVGVRNFHFAHHPFERFQKQVSCYLARTTIETMKIIRDNKEKSPMFNGAIKGVGARYCPSIEDKAYRYPDKNSHHIFVEPESHDLDTVYPSGISTSLPKDVQEDFMRTIEGLEKCEILIPGYAVEYDVIDTTNLSYGLEYKGLKGLYFAGQVNGTSGYEEAAAQGLIAGINAVNVLRGTNELKLSRKNSYIGVMIEDLISNTRDEPYRLFTARSENRLFVREDNANLRMYDYRKSLGLNEDIDRYNDNQLNLYNTLMNLCENYFLSASDPFVKEIGIKINRRMSLSEVLKQAKIDPITTLKQFLEFNNINVPHGTIQTVGISNKYKGYIDKANEHYGKLAKLDTKQIDWKDLCVSENISFECKQRIEKIKPETFGQLKLIEGIRPATLAAVAGTF